MLLLSLLAVPVVVGVVAFFLGKRRITPIELAIQIGVVGALIVGGYYATRWMGVRDVETWNGRIARKDAGSSSCCHSYECNCRQECRQVSNGSGGTEERCERVCDTCYEHANDYYYAAYSTNGERVYYDGCNAPESGTPAVYLDIVVGEPTAVEHAFTNYVKADPDALIDRRPELRAFDGRVPPYPRVYGWRAHRFVFVGVHSPDAARLDDALAELNADLGAAKQVNVVVVVAAEDDPAYFDAIRARWLGGKKNDVVVVIGTPAFPAIAWARVMAWNRASSAEDAFRGALAYRLEALGTFDGDRALAIIRDEVDRGYHRRPFSELEYLMARARPSTTAVLVLLAIGLALSAFLQWLFWRNRHRMVGLAPHARVQRAWGRARAWWRARRAASGEPDGPD